MSWSENVTYTKFGRPNQVAPDKVERTSDNRTRFENNSEELGEQSTKTKLVEAKLKRNSRNLN